jgi:BASS family bile acid:Na+ symporter
MTEQLLLPAGLSFIMFAVGLALTGADFRRVLERPRAVAIGLAGQMLLLPALAWLLVIVFAPPPAFAVGLIILAACPGGVTSNLLTHLAGGSAALAVTLTGITSLAGAATVPLLVNLALVQFGGWETGVELPVLRMSLGLFGVATLPLGLGMALKRWRPLLAERMEPVVRRIATVVFAVIVIAAFTSQWPVMMAHADAVLPPALALNVAGMSLAAALARGARLSRREGIAVVLETGLQNGALGIFVATTLLGRGDMMVPSIVYALVMNVTALGFILLRRTGPMLDTARR